MCFGLQIFLPGGIHVEENNFQVGPGDEVDWLRSDLEESPVIAVKKKSLVNKLDDLARREFCIFVFLSFCLFVLVTFVMKKEEVLLIKVR